MSDEMASPGPWRVKWHDVVAADGSAVAFVIMSPDRIHRDRWAADAALIASAPTLRDQLDRAVALLRDYFNTGRLADAEPAGCQCRGCTVRAFLSEVDKP